MSKTIDEKVVSMRFDNAQFEKNVSNTMSTLDKLKQSLKLDGASKGLEQVDATAKRLDFSGISKGIETVKAKFSALQVMAVTALGNITNSAINAGKKIASAFTIDPIKSGFQEYETQINAVQTILANTESKGSTLQDVNNALAELNTYADKTIYNFTEMTRNIGTFTAAGIDLKTSVSAIKGIANLAAVSGSTSQQASTAMYQLSQALASGTVKLMDWNSVVNAGMGGQVFQDALKQTARIHGVAIDSMIKKEGSFRETLQKGWLTSEILTETLNNFTLAAEEGTAEWETYKKSLMDKGYAEDQAVAILKMANTATDAATKVKTFTQLMDTLKEAAQSGWTKSWEIMIGDFEEAKNFLTDISDRLGAIIGNSADARNKTLSEGLSSGWKQLMNAGIADEEGYKDTLKSVAKEHGTSIDDMIAAEKKLDESLTDGEAFQKALKKGFTESKISSDMLTESVHKMADKMSKMSAKELEAAGYTADHVKQIKELSAGLKDGSISMDDFVKKMTRTSGRENIIQALWNSFDGLMNIITPIKEAFREIFPSITGDQVYRLTERIRDLTASFKEITEKYAPQIKSTFKGIFSVAKVGVDIVKNIISGISKLVGKLLGFSGGILDVTASIGDFVSKIATSITSANLFGKVINKIVGFLEKAIDKIREFSGNAIDNLKKFKDSLKEKIHMPGIDDILKVFKKIGEVLGKVGKKVAEIAAKIGKAIFGAFKNGDLNSLVGLANGGILTSILLSLKKFVKGFKEFKEAAKDKGGIKESIIGVLDGVKSNLEEWQKSIKAGTILKIAVAIGILALALAKIASIPTEKLGQSLGAITAMFVELIGSMVAFEKIDGDYKGAFNAVKLMIGISVSLLILASALKKLSALSWEELGKGLTGVLGLMVIIVGALALLSKIASSSQKIFSVTKKGIFGKSSKANFISMGLSMIAIAAAMKIFASAAKDFAQLDWEELGKAGAAIGGILIEMAGFFKLMQLAKPEKMISTALAMIAIGAALKVFASAAKDFAQFNWEELGKAGAAIAGILLMVGGFSKLTKDSNKPIKTALGLLVVGAAMKVFASACKDFAQMDWEGLGKAGAAIGGILIAVAAFAKIIGGSEKIFSIGKNGIFSSGTSNNLISMGLALIAIAAAMKIFASAMQDFAGFSWEELGKAGAAVGGLLLALSLALNAMKGTLPGSLALLVAVGALLLLVPVMQALGSLSWESIIKGLVSVAGMLLIFGVAAYALAPVSGVLLTIAGSLALFGVACLAIGVGILALAAGLTALAGMTTAAAAGIVAAIGVIVIGLLRLIPAIVDVLTEAIVAVCNVIIQSAPAIAQAIKAVVLSLIDILVVCIPAIADGALKLLVGVLQALVTYTGQLVDLLVEFVVDLLNALTTKLPQLVECVVSFIVALFDAVSANISPLIEAGTRLFGAIFLGIAEALGPIVETIVAPLLEILTNLFAGLADIIAPYIPIICDACVQIAQAITQIIQTIAPYIPIISATIIMIVQTITSAITQIVQAIVAIVQQIAPIINSITDLIRQLGDSITQILIGVSIVIQTVGNVIAQAFQGIANVITACGDAIRNSLDGLAGVFDSVFGGIADVVNSVGDSIRTVLDGIAGIIESIGEAALNAGTGFEKLANGVKTITKLNLADMAISMGSVATNIGKITSHSEELAQSGEGMKQIADGVKLSSDAFARMSAGITVVSTTLSSIGSIAVNAMALLTSSVSNSVSCFASLSASAASASASVVVSISSMASTCAKAAKIMVRGFSGVGRALMSKLDDAAKTASDYYDSFYSAGSNIAQGLADGIEYNAYKAKNAAENMAEIVEEIVRTALDINSPSKVFRAIAYSIPEGFAQGIYRRTWMVEDSAVSMADSAVNNTKSILSRIVDTINSDVDTQPTIRPVVDLSNVTDSANSINSLFTMAPSIGVMSNIGAISSMMNRNQNRGNDDVVSAIDALSKRLGNTSGDTYNINGLTYDDGSNITDAVKTIIRAARIERRT